MQVPPNDIDGSEDLVLAVENTISFWIKPVENNGVLFTK